MHKIKLAYDSRLEKELFSDTKRIINYIDSGSKGRDEVLANYALAACGADDKKICESKRSINSFYKYFEKKDMDELSVSENWHSLFNKIFERTMHAPKLTSMIDDFEGNCIAHATYYSIIALKAGIDIGLMTSNRGLHFLNVLRINDDFYYIDCNKPSIIKNNLIVKEFSGIDYVVSEIVAAFSYLAPARLSDLLSAVYRSRAYKERDDKKALQLYHKAIILNPKDSLSKIYVRIKREEINKSF